MTRRNDPAAAWRIRERGAPSPRALQALVGRYAREVAATYQRAIRRTLIEWAREVGVPAPARADAEGDPTADQIAGLRERLRVSVREAFPGSPRPPLDRVRALLVQAGIVAVRAERRYLVSLGARPERLAQALQLTPDEAARGILGIDIAPGPIERAALEGRVREALDLIRAIPQDQLIGYETWIAGDIRAGMRVETIARGLAERAGIDERHARLIARDQIGKLNGAIVRETQTGAGVEEYRWRVTTDSRLRDTHAAVADQVFRWDGDGAPNAGPYGEPAHPGEAIQCRCGAEPIPPAWLTGA